jgi:hypothetical protein
MKLYKSFFISLSFIFLFPSAYAMQGNHVTLQQACPDEDIDMGDDWDWVATAF